MTDLPDINVWLALVDQRHVHHPLAKAYWARNGAGQIAFCRITMLGFLRIATNSKAVAAPKTNREAWTVYQQFIAFPNIQLLDEPPGTDAYFQSLTTQSPLPHRLWTDAYLAAFAIAGGLRLVSLDTDFARFTGLHFLHIT